MVPCCGIVTDRMAEHFDVAITGDGLIVPVPPNIVLVLLGEGYLVDK